ncbi:hypothetical protein LIER_12569 [Lithospermum erythrorhizon]|uniref:Uncharacterized protein n=1 Tax=Lithospermum erythrorhizon TaxID=34254 RepID=A0AAV3PXG2_LITER
MSRPQNLRKPFISFGNPFRMISPKGLSLPPKLVALLDSFEETLTEKLKTLKPRDGDGVLSLSWMTSALEALCAIHTEVKSLIAALELPVSDWDGKWIDVYLDNSVKLLDVCIAFSSEVSRLNQGNLFLQCVLHNLDSTSAVQFTKAQSSLDGWRQHVSSKNLRIEKCFTILGQLIDTLDLPRIKNSSKGRVLMRAMYGVRMVTVFICNVFAVAFSSSSQKLVDLPAPEACLWAEAFTEVQVLVNGDIQKIHSSGKVTGVKELEAVDTIVKRLHTLVQQGEDIVEVEALRSSIKDLGKSSGELTQGLDFLARGIDGFFQIVLTGRDALLGKLRVGNDVSNTMQQHNHVKRQVVR